MILCTKGLLESCVENEKWLCNFLNENEDSTLKYADTSEWMPGSLEDLMDFHPGGQEWQLCLAQIAEK